MAPYWRYVPNHVLLHDSSTSKDKEKLNHSEKELQRETEW